MRRASIAAVACLATLAAPDFATARERTVTGTVVDSAGAPVADVELASFWQFDAKGWNAYGGFRTGSDGTFEGAVRFYGRPIALLAIDSARERAGLATLDDDRIGAPVTITLAPLVRVHGRFTSAGLGGAPTWTNVYMNVMPGRIRVASSMSTTAAFEFGLPPGNYQFYAYGRDVVRRTETMTLTADTRVVDRGTIDLAPTIIARHYGKTPPAINVTDARGAAPGVALADYAGKWVLLEFWGYW